MTRQTSELNFVIIGGGKSALPVAYFMRRTNR